MFVGIVSKPYSMKKEILFKSLISIGVFLLTFVVFTLLQNQGIYNATLGKLSNNYGRIGGDKKNQIIETKIPYEKITQSNIYRWDAKLYKCVSDSMYVNSDFYYKERLAYYPLFPLLWKISMIDSSLIFIINYLLFTISLILLLHLLKNDNRNNQFIFMVALILPSTIIYYLPYAESLFLFTMVISMIGLFKRKYWLFFLGAFAFSMTRPAAQIFLFAIMAADIRYFLIHRKINYFLKEIVLKILPFILGILLVIYIQYCYSGSWTAYFDALIFWPAESGFFNTILDWSVEGFGMTVFAIFFLAIPSLVYALIWGMKIFKKNEQYTIQPPSLFSGNSEWIKEYMFNTSVLFTAGNLLYTFLTSGNVLNGFYRYTMAVPFFYIILFLFHEKVKNVSFKYKMFAFGLCLLGMILFLANVIYGGDRFRFPYVGLYLSVFLLLFILAEPYLSYRNKWLIILLLILPCILWLTYLFNMYLCDGWLFT